MTAGSFLYIGIDDTDNLETRGTGFRARQLIEQLEAAGLAAGIAVTRHQLLVDDRIPYTSHNSSACLVVKLRDNANKNRLVDFCRTYLLENSAPGSDAGLCVASYEQAKNIIQFGQKAKVEVLTQNEARETAGRYEICLEGLTGDHQGIIGALSATGLHVHGNDGRYLWPRDIREYAGQSVSVQELRNSRGIDQVTLQNGDDLIDETAIISLGEWPRTVRINHQSVLLVEQLDARHQYKVLEKDIIKSIRP